MDFDRYVEFYNAGDERKLAEAFYTEDIVFDGGNRLFEGQEAFLEYLHNVGLGLRQTMRPLVVVQGPDHVFAEMDFVFTATEDKLDFPFRALREGESVTLRFFGSYYLRDGRIARIHLANWAEPR